MSSIRPYDFQYSTDILRFSARLEQMAKLLQLYPYRYNGVKKQTVTYSPTAIEPIYILCPPLNTCQTATCQPYGLSSLPRDRDISQIRLIKTNMVHHYTYAVAGQCNHCK